MIYNNVYDQPSGFLEHRQYKHSFVGISDEEVERREIKIMKKCNEHGSRTGEEGREWRENGNTEIKGRVSVSTERRGKCTEPEELKAIV